ncbi:MAG TPA: hypothetical protein VGB82_10270 [Alphaproteobacteria bacterium]
MDPAYLSAVAALSGSVIGGFTSLAASWMSQNVQARTQQIVEEKTRRQKLYKSFIEEASRLYGDALVSDKVEVATLIGLYAMVSRMRVHSTAPVVESAEKVVSMIVDTYFGPNKTLRELRGAIGSHDLDPLRHFSDACREDLRQLRST